MWTDAECYCRREGLRLAVVALKGSWGHFMLTEGDRAEKLNVELIVEDRTNLQVH